MTHIGLNSADNVQNSMLSQVPFTKSVLRSIQKIVFLYKVYNSSVHNFLIDSIIIRQ